MARSHPLVSPAIAAAMVTIASTVQAAAGTASGQSTVPSSSAPSSKTAEPPACDTPEHAQMDFWIGEWDVHWSSSDGQMGFGTNSISREHGGCVIVERYQDRTTPFSGTSISSYRRGLGRWTQTFMATGGFFYQATGGPADDGAIELRLVPQAESQPEGRVRFEDIGPNSFTWRFQMKPAGEEWKDLTSSRYIRRTDAGVSGEGSTASTRRP